MLRIVVYTILPNFSSIGAFLGILPGAGGFHQTFFFFNAYKKTVYIEVVGGGRPSLYKYRGRTVRRGRLKTSQKHLKS